MEESEIFSTSAGETHPACTSISIWLHQGAVGNLRSQGNIERHSVPISLLKTVGLLSALNKEQLSISQDREKQSRGFRQRDGLVLWCATVANWTSF
jgi:hypothetical protein